MMWFLLLLLHITHTELVTAVDKLILRNADEKGNPCEGRLEVYHDNRAGYVGDKYWSENTEKVVCKSTHCGNRVESSDMLVDWHTNTTVWLNELKCQGNESYLWKCDGPGWNLSYYNKPMVKKVKCSSNINISVEGQCAGAVQYTDGQKEGYFCDSNWGESETKLLCERLGCGDVGERPRSEWMITEKFQKSEKIKLDCSGIENVNNLWQCVTEDNPASCKPASIICTGYTRLQLKGDLNVSDVCSGQLEKETNDKWVPVEDKTDIKIDACQQMHCGTSGIFNRTDKGLHVTCPDKVKVVLRNDGGESTCYGTVNIRVNDSVKPVCASIWEKTEAEMVCKELKCGKLLYFNTQRSSSGIMDYVKCKGSESSLWHCQAQHGKNIQCTSQPYVVCSGSVDVKLVDGPGKCAGRLEIRHEGKWKLVNNKTWTNPQTNSVCKQLGCGNTGKIERFSQGSGNFLSTDCTSNQKISDISECITAKFNDQSGDRNVEAVGITCEDHKVVFLNGPAGCSGHVKIEHGSKTYWLSGSTETWNQESANTVCHQMHCGNAENFTSSKADINHNIWNESRSCSSGEKSLFECKTMSQPQDHNNFTAYVKCSGKINITLASDCYGNVRICAEGTKCGDVCGDTWTQANSEMLCENLGCGKALTPSSQSKSGNIVFKSLHTSSEATNLTQCNFVKNKDNDNTCNQNPAYVVCSGSVKSRFRVSRDKCSGNVEVQYDGKWLPVRADALKDIKTQNTICQELECGNAVKTLSYFGPTPAADRVISGLQCSADAMSSLSACSITTTAATTGQSKIRTTDLGGLQCSDWKTLGILAMKASKTCSGQVVIYSEGKKNAVSSEGWTETEKERLCQDLKCSGHHAVNVSQSNVIVTNSSWKRSFSCTGIKPESIWECEKKTPPSQINELFIECQGEPKITLSQKCYGQVKINGLPVCDSGWEKSYSDRVCQDLDCGIAVVDKLEQQSPHSSDSYHVSCDGNHYYFGHCKKIKGKCDTRVVSISCSESVKFRTTEKYGGTLEVNYRDKWERVCSQKTIDKLSPDMKEKLCELTRNVPPSMSKQSNQVNLETTLECTADHSDIKRCIKKLGCGRDFPATIFCPGYVKPTPPPKPPESPKTTAPIIVGVGFLLVAVILIFVFVRFYVLRRARKSKVSSRMLPRKEVEFESGEYEDVNKENEMEDFSRGRFRSEAEFIREKDGQSVSSLSYDDVDDADEARPLTFPGTTVPAARDDSMHEDGVTYEVEDPQESYDDIDTIPETTQTTAEVHDSPQTTPDLNTAAPPGLVQRDEDYLEPDQDG